PETFRDNLLPGSRESWKFRVSDAHALPVIAEVAAGMYDASLDNIRPFAWYFVPVTYSKPYYRSFTESEGLRPVYGSDAVERKEKETPPFAYDRLNWRGAFDFPVPEVLLTRNKQMMTAAAPPPSAQAERVEIQAEGASGDASFQQDVLPEAGRQEVPAPFPAPSLRTNFNETAFFFPSLLTDREGGIAVNFTLPESNTTWKLQTLAHTADLKYGMSTHQVVTQKPLMALPNLPRFLRQGDEARISAQIINLSGKETSGHARLELFDPANDRPILPANAPIPFSLPAGGTTTVGWRVTLPEAAGLVGCRIIAGSEAGSDGEQHLLPVLPDEILVTESIPFYLAGEREKQVEVKDAQASPDRRLQRMTVEFSSNPVWYAVQALPALAQPRNDDVVSWFASYYSQTLAAFIARSNPRIRNVIDRWEAQKETTSTLLSNLERNEELKTILLEETPWVMDAQTETEQKQHLSLLFDVNRTSYRREAAMQQLLRQQHEEGGWGWFKGFHPDRNITLYVLDGMSKLSRLGAAAYNRQEKEMQIKALSYLDKAIREDYERLRKAKGSILNSGQLQYLYVRSAYRDIPEANESREAIRYFTEQAEKQWTKASLYEKGLIALLMHRNGKEKAAKEILDWLRKTAVTSAEKGMYWPNNRRENHFFVSPIDVHCLLMTAFQTIGTDAGETDRMKQWLLNQKRTQNREPAPSAVNAIYSLLASGSDWLAETNSASIQWGDKTLHTSAGEAATGYIRETVSGKDITPAMQTLTLRKEGKAPAWGAVYYQYFESIGKVDKQGGALSVEKKLFLETNNGSQRQIVPVDADKPLKTGDKVIVRLTIRTDRDMEYVSLKDLRAGCFEPAVQQSGVRLVDRLLCYHSPKDASENFFFDRLPAGTYVLEYAAYVSRSGRYGNGMATLQCLYAPEFVSHTEGNIIFVQE
ncbi:MAG: alpha-2-macroglobulin, partial [Tannerellaceae bacterium]|nr:alpha-2-macroglobulin [Tannerellaceae bacterium]